ncbi:hypothetical protein EV286_111133 [Rhizobium sp. BK251]|nr:hypothetical protein EV286_111133 [Rhizobium sp. BK251]
MNRILVGLSLVVFGMLLLISEVLFRKPIRSRYRNAANDTQGTGFLGLTRNTAGLILMAAGATMLIATG